jgi:hypothetical protein
MLVSIKKKSLIKPFISQQNMRIEILVKTSREILNSNVSASEGAKAPLEVKCREIDGGKSEDALFKT